MAGGNPQNNGLSQYNTTNVGNRTQWILSMDILPYIGKTFFDLSGFCIGPDGTIYAQKQDYESPSKRGLVAINPWGTLKWFSTATAGYGEVGPSLVVGADGYIYCICNLAQQTPPDPVTGNYQINVDNRILALNPEDGSKRWDYASSGGSLSQYNQLAVCPNGLLVFTAISSGVSSVTALYSNGSLAWEVPINGLVNMIAVSSNSTSYVVSADGHFFSIDPNGNILWSVSGVVQNGSFKSISLDNHDNIYLLANSADYSADHLFKYYPNGTMDWAYEPANYTITPPVMDIHDNIYFSYTKIIKGTVQGGSPTTGIMSMNPEGQPRWTIHSESGPMAVSADGIIYVASDHLMALNDSGTILWEKDGLHPPSLIDQSQSGQTGEGVVIGQDGTVFFLYSLSLPGGQLEYFLGIKGTPTPGDPGLDQQTIIPIIAAMAMFALVIVLFIVKKRSGRLEH